MTREELQKENAELKQLLKSMATSLEQQAQTIAQLNQEIAELKEKLNKNSKNSSKPPSSDGLSKPKSLRGSSGKKPGAQKGHSGNGLSLFAKPDETMVHKPSQCNGCPYEGQCKRCRKSAVRNVLDIEIKTKRTAHFTEAYECFLLDNAVISGEFPESVASSVQYGDGVKSLAIALNTAGMMSINRTHEILSAVLSIPISTGTIATMVQNFAGKISDTVDAIRKAILAKPVVNCDETGTRTEGTNFWVHSACDSEYTYLSLQKKRGKEGMDNAGFLPEYAEIIVHDCWGPYWKYDLSHGLCCAHLLRELNGVIENHPHQKGWAEGFKKLLYKMNTLKDKTIAKGTTAISRYHRRRLDLEYDQLMEVAKKANPEPEKISGQRGRIKCGKVLSLINRLIAHKAEVCLFIKDFKVPFTNNLAEQSIRMVKVKTKVSGCFRTEAGAKEFIKIMSYLGTAKKHGINTYKAIRVALSGASRELLFGAD